MAGRPAGYVGEYRWCPACEVTWLARPGTSCWACAGPDREPPTLTKTTNWSQRHEVVWANCEPDDSAATHWMVTLANRPLHPVMQGLAG